MRLRFAGGFVSQAEPLTPSFLSWSLPSRLCHRSRFGGANLGNQIKSITICEIRERDSGEKTEKSEER
jgi:hypothetical protein